MKNITDILDRVDDMDRNDEVQTSPAIEDHTTAAIDKCIKRLKQARNLHWSNKERLNRLSTVRDICGVLVQQHELNYTVSKGSGLKS